MTTNAATKPFQFLDGRPSKAYDSQESDRENAVAAATSPSKTGGHVLSDSPSKHFPSTPATRLPLAELIGTTDENKSQTKGPDVSPDEHIDWAPTSSSKRKAKSTPARKNKKRARSSSPPSSGRTATSKPTSTTKEPLNLQDLRNTLQTPQNNPTADLWGRYAVEKSADFSVGSQLQHSSSPHLESEQDGNVSGLRRWTSCGIEFPSARAKRRKLGPTAMKENISQVFGVKPNPPTEPKNGERPSNIGSLLERIQQSLSKPKDAPEKQGPSSSSPLPDKEEQFDRKSISPCRAPELAETHAKKRQDWSHGSNSTPTHQRREPLPTRDKTLSSFGSDDMDAELLAEIPKDATNPANGDHTDEKYKTSLSHADVPSNVTPQEHVSQIPEIVEDDFDDDDELTMEDFGDVNENRPREEAIITTQAKPMDPDVIRRAAMLSNSSVRDDDYGDLDIDEDDFVAAEAAATQPGASSSNPSKSVTKTRVIQRYLIKEIAEAHFVSTNGAKRPEKVIQVVDEQTGRFKAITLRDSWIDTRCTKGSYVHIIGCFDSAGHCIVDDAENILILHPDHLVSALVVADSFTCLRRAVLQDRVKATSDSNPYIMYGTMLHELFQEALKANRWDADWLQAAIEETARRNLEAVYENRLSFNEVIDHMRSKMPELQAWAKIFVTAKPKLDGVVNDRQDSKVLMSINRLLDVEEHVWSPMYGLKGNIDATVQVTMQDERGERNLVVPFELKTGRNTTNASHRAQTALYTLLLADRYDVAIAYGILYYLESSQISRIPRIRHELRHMIMQRNELACYVRERLTLPPMVRNTHQCNKCYAKTTCFLYHKLAEGGDGETSGLREKFEAVVKSLGPTDQVFFRKWDELLTKEETEMMKFKRELWTMLSKDREKLGRCFGNVILEPGSEHISQTNSKINRFQYTFRKRKEVTTFSFHESQISTGEPIVVSDETGHYALAKGYVTQVQDHRITVAVDRRLHNARVRQKGFDPDVNQSFSAIMDVESSTFATQADSVEILFRLDKDEFSNGMALARNNLVELMNNETFGSRRLRELIVHSQQPVFKSKPTGHSISGPPSQSTVNEDQRAAIDKILSAEDYALVLGMPGTGKTTTIAHIIRTLVAKGKSVLLASYTHTAVDNILLKVRQDKIGVLRLGALAKIHPEVREFAVLAAEPKESLEEMERAYTEPKVVATTCLGIGHQVFRQRIFDYCIVDEASQITLPVCLGPIRMAKSFVLVGDHYQLPPLVQNSEAQKGGLDMSLFKLLSESHSSAVTTLCHQYRMNAEIMSIANTLIYSGRLRCGSESNAVRRLDIPNFEALSMLHRADTSPCSFGKISSTCWLEQALSPAKSSPVVFLNTDPLRPEALDKAQGAHIVNHVEASLATQLVRTLLVLGVPASTIGVTTLYRSQLALIKTLLTSEDYGLQHGQAHAVEAHTTDRFQGRDKEVMILSCVRSNDRNFVGDLLKDWRRVNVAVTRAKSKLIILGSKQTLSEGDPLLQKLVDMCDTAKWTLDLHRGTTDVSSHSFSSVPTSPVSLKPEAISKSPKSSPLQQPRSSVNVSPHEAAAAKARIPLAPRTANAPSRPNNPKYKNPLKKASASVGVRMGLGRNGGAQKMREKRPVLADLVSEIVGEEYVSME